MKKKLLLFLIIIGLSFCRCSYQTGKYTFEVKNFQNKIELKLHQTSPDIYVQYQFKYILDNSDGAKPEIEYDNNSNKFALEENKFYSLRSGTTSINYLKSNSDLCNMTIILQCLTSRRGSDQLLSEKIKTISL